MSSTSKIEWTDATWNPVRGCSIVSKGCTNCYAMRQAHRSNRPGGAYEGLTQTSKGGPVWTGKVRLVPELLDKPLHWKRPRRIFVNSMSDLFHEAVPATFIDDVFRVIAQCDRHVFQILTKRPERMLDWFASQPPRRVLTTEREQIVYSFPLPNVWLGVSVEDQARAEERIPLLLQTPAAVRWISAEPLLGDIIVPSLHELDWVVAGGESGPGARPMHPAWARRLRDECALAHVPFFFKQWGAWAPVGPLYSDNDTEEHLNAMDTDPDEWPREVWLDRHGNHQDGGHQAPIGTWALRRVGKRVAGRLLDGRAHDEYPAHAR